MARPLDYALLFLAVALHYVGNDHHLREHHKEPYDRVGRWLLAGAILIGWAAGEAHNAAGIAADTQPVTLAVLGSFLAGGVILNVVKSELPAREGRCFPSFVGGAAAYAAVLLLV